MYQQPPFFYPNPLIYRNKQYVRQYLSTPVVLILGILQIVNAAITVLSSLIIAPISKDLTYILERYLENISTENIFFSFSTSISIPIVPIALAIAFLLMYRTSKKNSQKNSDANGATAFWIVSIFQLIGLIFSAILIALAFGIFSLALNQVRYETHYSYDPTEYSSTINGAGIATAVLGISLIILVVVFVVNLIYIINQLRFASSIKKSLTGPVLVAKGAKAYSVMSVIFAVFSCFGVVAGAISFFAVFFAADDIIQTAGLSSASKTALISYMGLILISAILTFANHIYMAKFALGYNKHIIAAGPTGCNLPMPVMVQNATMPQPAEQVPAEQTKYTPVTTAATEVMTPATTKPDATAITDAEVPVTTESATPATPSTDSSPETQPAEETTPSHCPQCGTQIAKGHSFCSNCGTKVV